MAKLKIVHAHRITMIRKACYSIIQLFKSWNSGKVWHRLKGCAGEKFENAVCFFWRLFFRLKNFKAERKIMDGLRIIADIHMTSHETHFSLGGGGVLNKQLLQPPDAKNYSMQTRCRCLTPSCWMVVEYTRVGRKWASRKLPYFRA